MPCRMDDMPCNPSPNLTKENAELKKRCDKLTRLLCEACETVEATAAMDVTFSKELQKWWDSHQQQDKKRQAKEKLQEQIAALQKQLKEIE